LKKLQKEEPPELTPFYVEEQRLYSELPPDGGAPHLSLRLSPDPL